jgi:mannose-6-phosphate isomerase-like protein (cupin superfamily)
VVAEARASVATPDTSTPIAPGNIEFYSAAQLARVADELAKGTSTGRTIGGHPSYRYVEVRRVVNGEPEVHDNWADVTIVQSGRATILTGGRVDGGRLEADGEHRGGTIVSGTSRPIAMGDVFVVPAGVPHQFQLVRGDSLRYLTLKVLQPMRRH